MAPDDPQPRQGRLLAWIGGATGRKQLTARRAAQTVTTVGYGDVVPSTVGGRLIGALVMLNGIAFLTVITASVTALLIEQARLRNPPPDQEALVTRLERIDKRLAAIESRRGGENPTPGG